MMKIRAEIDNDDSSNDDDHNSDETVPTDHVGTEGDHPHAIVLGGSAASSHQQATRGAHSAADLIHDEVQVTPVTVRSVL